MSWFPAGFYIVEQGEPGASLYLILSGHVDVLQEGAGGELRRLNRLGPGEFFGELAIVQQRPRTAHVVAAADVTCMVFAPGAPTGFAGRGAGARFLGDSPDAAGDELCTGATTCVDVSAHVEQKIAAVTAHRSQYLIEPDMFPPALLREMLCREYFVRMDRPPELETELWPAAQPALA